MKRKYFLNDITDLDIQLKRQCIIFLKGDLWAGKTTMSQYIIRNLLGVSENIISPTYTYYNKYYDIYHFDLYRLKNYDEFFAIGGEDILYNNRGIILVEWTELIEKHYDCDIEIILEKTSENDQREISIIYK